MSLRAKLARDPANGKLGGVLAGAARELDIDPALMRAGYGLLTVLTVFVPGIVAYLLAWALLPPRNLPPQG